ncbi:phosphate acyltransferase PlsX [Salinicoccus roseus]|uniref:phosphate acyltransferase PlsX n=1 Tax=Salinicoccus roseus TaxID=45670 RepID=UPI000F4E3EFA|nr:phosphate acyltransferase PlsX [Salinicoccus roseus]RPE54471.1 phosphate:acyl-[acyl carrier protein] acyltransferase [Salinicoccus roseus]GGA65312.1 phosphate acyltransferase [Salinicoccus roseus]
MVKIAVDLMGGDNAPEEIEKGVLQAVEADEDLEVLLFGLKGAYSGDHPRVEFIEVTEKIESEDDPVRSVRRKKDSSLVRACRAVKDGEADACVSAGNTGALMSAGLFVVGRIKGVERPAIATLLPTTGKKGMMLLDMGANAENKPQHLYQFAVMADLYMRENEGRSNPTIGLVNNGSEANKGSELTKETYKLLEDSGLNFTGNFETREILSGKIDIAVTDGFTGNVILKTIEGTAMSLMGEVKNAFLKNAKNKLAALVLKKDVQSIRDLLDYRHYGGAPLLGLNGHVLKAHGSSDSVAIVSALKQAKRMAESDAITKIKERVGEA